MKDQKDKTKKDIKAEDLQKEEVNQEITDTEANSESTPKENKKSKSKKKKSNSREKELQDKVNELNDKYLRLYSEFDNYRRRTTKERLELSKTASEDVIVELLPIIDDFERAIKSTEETKDCEAVKEGMQLIYNKIATNLEKKGLKAIKSVGKDFDTDFHEAITYVPAPNKKLKGKIVDEVEKGYMLHDKVIRYTKVVIGQ